jgi:transposase
MKKTILRLPIEKVKCLSCQKIANMQPSFAEPYVSYSKKLATMVCELAQQMTLSAVAKWVGLGWGTVKDIVKSDLARRYKVIPLEGVTRMAIDENFLGSTLGYMTVVLDLESGRVLWVAEGKGKAALEGFWPKLAASKAKIEAVACDMSAAYWSAVREHLPDALQVFDRFHVVALGNEAVDQTRRELQHSMDKEAIKASKGTRFLLLKGEENLDPSKGEPTRLEAALALNLPLSKAHYLKEHLRELWNQSSPLGGMAHLLDWMGQAQTSGVKAMQKLAGTVLRHLDGIMAYFWCPITSGPLEGLNNKIGRMTRMAYGYRDKAFLFLRIYALHESKTFMTGL